jgi:hypothetical protein
LPLIFLNRGKLMIQVESFDTIFQEIRLLTLLTQAIE